jgi:pimeloyl-ACP methyl ester carboxylesterase
MTAGIAANGDRALASRHTERDSALATYVLVPGGGHGGWCYQGIATLLRSHGHDVYTPTLTGVGERAHLLSPQVDLEFHIKEIARLLWFEDLDQVILVGHGYGGMVITGAADRAPKRVGHLLYLDFPTPGNGQCLSDIAPSMVIALRRSAEVFNGVELCAFPDVDLLPYWGVVDPAVVKWMLPRLTPHPWKCFEQPLRLIHEDALRAIPQSHVVSTLASTCCDIDRLRELAQGRMWELQTGHDMMLTEPLLVAEKLIASLEWLPGHRVDSSQP